MEEELRLDLGPALEAIRGELTRALEEVPRTFRDAFGDALVGIVGDFGAAAELARGEMERVLAQPFEVGAIDVPVVADTTALAAIPAQVEDASGEVKVPVDVNDAELIDVAGLIADLNGQTIDIETQVDTSGVEAATEDMGDLNEATESVKGQIREVTSQFATISSGVADLNDFGVGRGAIAGLTTVVLGFGAAAIDADSKLRSFNTRVGDLSEILQRVDVAGLNTDLSTLAIQIGADDDALRLALASFVSLGEGSGRSRTEIGKLGQELTALSAYLSVTNPALGTAEEIAQRLPVALARGGRALAPYGIALDSATVSQRALTDSGKDSIEQLTIFDRAAAGLAITVENLGGKLKTGLDEGLETPAVRLRAIKVAVAESVEALGAQFIEPILEISEQIGPALEDVANAVAGAGNAFAGVLVPAFQVLGPLVSTTAKAFDALPDSVVAAGATAYVATKAFAGLQGALKALAIAEAEAALVSEASAAQRLIAAQGVAAAQAQVAIATGARIAAEAELIAAQVALTVTEGARLGLQVDLAVAEAAVVVATQAEAVAMLDLAAAEGVATAATLTLEATFPPLLIFAAAFAAVMTVLQFKADGVKNSFHELGQVTNEELVREFDLLGRLAGSRTGFFTELAKEDLPAARQLRDALSNAGRDVQEYDRIIQTAAAHEKEAARDKEASAESTRKYIEALNDADPVVRAEAANALKLSLAYEGLDPEIRKVIDSIIAQDKASKNAGDAAKELAQRVQDTADAAANASTEFDNAVASLSAYLGLAVDAGTQDLKFAVTLDELRAKQAAYTKEKGKGVAVYALETVEGRKNIDSLIGIAEQQAKILANNVQADKSPASIERATRKYNEQVEALRRVAAETGLSKEQFDGLLKSVGLLPEQIDAAISITGVDEAKAKADSFKSDIEKLPIEVRITTTVDESEAYQRISRVLSGLGPFSVPITQLDFLNPDQLGYSLNADGNVYAPVAGYAAGGIRDAERYANGEDHTAQISTTMRLWAEPETGGEAYIPLSPAKRERSTDILEDVAGRFGYDLVPGGAARFAGGDVLGAVAGAGAAAGNAEVLRALDRLTEVVRGVPDRIPGGVTANIELSQQEADTLDAIGARLRAASGRR